MVLKCVCPPAPANIVAYGLTSPSHAAPPVAAGATSTASSSCGGRVGGRAAGRPSAVTQSPRFCRVGRDVGQLRAPDCMHRV